MKTRHQIAAYMGLLGMTTLVAILISIRDRLIAIGPWVLGILLAVIGLVMAYLLHKLYVSFRKDRLALQARIYEVEGQKQALRLESERWEVERASLLLGQHLQTARIYPDAKGYLPTLVQLLPDGNQQFVNLPHPIHQARIAGQNNQMLLPEHAGAHNQAIPASIRYEEIRSQIPRGRSCLGVSENGVEHCDFGQLMTMWICGGSSTGKSNTVALKIDEAIRNGRKIGIILVDPHARKEDSLYNKIRCYESYFLCRVAVNETDILTALEWFKTEFERRLEEGGSGQTDILLVVDEVSNVVESDDPEIGKLIKKIARICGQESRGFGMFGWFISQDAAGLSWLRKRAMTVIAHKLNMMSERKLACNEDMDIARDMDSWPRGRVAVYGLNFQGVMVTQMPAFNPPVVDGSIEETPDEMEELQPKSSLPNSTNKGFQAQPGKMREDRPEENGEAGGRQFTEETLNNPLVLKKFLNEAGKMRAEGMSIDAILKSYGLPPGGRNNQNLKALLDGQDQAAEG
jgi:hypothetical protein